jgi:hypothetical protein
LAAARPILIGLGGIAIVAAGFLVGTTLGESDSKAEIGDPPRAIVVNTSAATVPTLPGAKQLPALQVTAPPPEESSADGEYTEPTSESGTYSPPVVIKEDSDYPSSPAPVKPEVVHATPEVVQATPETTHATPEVVPAEEE